MPLFVFQNRVQCSVASDHRLHHHGHRRDRREHPGVCRHIQVRQSSEDGK